MLVSTLDLNATGCPSDNMTAPSADSDAPYCRVTSLLGSKYFNIGSLVINYFTCFHDFSCVSFHCHCTSLSNRRVSGSVTSDRLGRNFARYVIILSILCRAFLSEGVGIAGPFFLFFFRALVLLRDLFFLLSLFYYIIIIIIIALFF